MEYKAILVSIENSVATIQLNRPEAMNTINRDMIEDILAALNELEKDAKIGALVITGSPGLFCAGADLNFTQELLSKNPKDALEFIRGSRRFFDRIATFKGPTITAISGRAFGGGLEIALACDFRLAASDATLGLPEIVIAAVPLGGGTQRLPRLIGPSKAKEMMMTGQIISAQEALHMGLVNKVLPTESFMAEVRHFAEDLASRAPLSIRTIKSLVDSSMEMTLSKGLDLENENAAQIVGSEDCKEGISAYLAKRKPRFKGR
jgi:enoyl-CoA hydratase/carnithine racemase